MNREMIAMNISCCGDCLESKFANLSTVGVNFSLYTTIYRRTRQCQIHKPQNRVKQISLKFQIKKNQPTKTEIQVKIENKSLRSVSRNRLRIFTNCNILKSLIFPEFTNLEYQRAKLIQILLTIQINHSFSISNYKILRGGGLTNIRNLSSLV